MFVAQNLTDFWADVGQCPFRIAGKEIELEDLLKNIEELRKVFGKKISILNVKTQVFRSHGIILEAKCLKMGI
jgi:hypothetical protein